MAGHSHWANIQRRKGAQDSKRAKLWSKCARALIVAAKQAGGDPSANLALRYAIDDAKAQNMPNATIDKAIKKGTGEGDTDTWEEITYEGYGPHGVAILLEALTNNRNRTAPELRTLFDKAGGNLAAANSVAYNFQRRARVTLPLDAATEDTLLELTLDAGVDDITQQDDEWVLLGDPTQYAKLRAAIEHASLPISAAGLTMIPLNTVTCTGEDARKLLAFVESLEDHDDIQKVYANFDIPDDELAHL